MGLSEGLFGSSGGSTHGGGGGVARRESLSVGSIFGGGIFPGTSSSSSSTSTNFLFQVVALHLIWVLTSSNSYSVMGAGSTECLKRKYYEITVSYFGGLSINRTVKCDMYFQWTVADYCCYDKYDRFERNPFCCYSETYKLVLAVGFICLVLLASSFSIFFCWLYNLPHHLLYLLTCGKFHLNDWMVRNKNGPYVDPTFYSGEPFWARGAEFQPYPLRPMPPKIFYPAPPPKLKYRWDMTNGEIPLFVIASRQFTRNPYSARPQDRSSSGTGSHHPGTHGSGGLFGSSESRRNSLSSNQNAGGVTASNDTSGSSAHSQLAHQQRQTGSAQNGGHGGTRRGSSAFTPYRNQPSKDPPPFQGFNIDETEAAQELHEALKMLDERGDKTVQEWNAVLATGDGDTYSTPEENNRRHDNMGQRGGNNGGGGSGSNSNYNNHNQMSSSSSGGYSSNGIFTLSDGVTGGGGGSSGSLCGVRPNTTGGGGSLDQYGNYVSLTNTLTKPNTDALNQQLSTLGLPIYSMPGVHTAGVVSTVQNYHVVSSNLGNPMETILEDDSLDDEIISSSDIDEDSGKLDDKSERKNERGKKISRESSLSSPSPTLGGAKDKNLIKSSPSPSNHQGSNNRRPLLKRRATSITSAAVESMPIKATPQSRTLSNGRVGSALDNVLNTTTTTIADVPFMPTLPGSLPEGSASQVDATFVDTAVRRNSVI